MAFFCKWPVQELRPKAKLNVLVIIVLLGSLGVAESSWAAEVTCDPTVVPPRCCQQWHVDVIDSRTGKIKGAVLSLKGTYQAIVAATEREKKSDRDLCRSLGPRDSDCFTTYGPPRCQSGQQASRGKTASGLTYQECLTLRQTREELPAIYEGAQQRLGEVTIIASKAENILSQSEDRLAATDSNSPQEFLSALQWVGFTAKDIVDETTSLTSSLGIGKAAGKNLGKHAIRVVEKVREGQSLKTAIEAEMKTWFGLQYNNGLHELRQTLEHIVLGVSHADELMAHEAQRIKLREEYIDLVERGKSEVQAIAAKAESLKHATGEIDAYRADIDKALAGECSWVPFGPNVVQSPLP